MDEILYTSVATEIGRVFVAVTPRGLCDVSLPRGRRRIDYAQHLRRKFQIEPVRCDSCAPQLTADLRRYFAGAPVHFDYALEPSLGTPFQRRAWQEVAKVPYGEVRSYKQIAEALGDPKKARPVGMANARNCAPIVIPCHRIIASDGGLGGYGYGLELKKRLLRMEGAL